jgi:hypothetical protein
MSAGIDRRRDRLCRKMLWKHWLLVICVVFVHHAALCIAIVSYTGDGSWEQADASTEECKLWTCSPNFLTWKQKTHPLKLYNNVTACEAFRRKGIKKIDFHGDSYLRHIYAAMLITMNGNYESGSMKDPNADKSCRYHQLFNEKRCNYWNLNHYGLVCNGDLLLDPLLTGFDDRECSKTNGTVSLWSFGNHPLGGNRYGVNDAAAFQKFFWHSVCPAMTSRAAVYTGEAGRDKQCSVWWVSTHARVVGHFHDETPERVQRYNEEMRAFFDSRECGNINYIDVFNMTSSLVNHHPTEANLMTWDKVHWGYEVNMVKAQIIINALLSS